MTWCASRPPSVTPVRAAYVWSAFGALAAAAEPLGRQSRLLRWVASVEIEDYECRSPPSPGETPVVDWSRFRLLLRDLARRVLDATTLLPAPEATAWRKSAQVHILWEVAQVL